MMNVDEAVVDKVIDASFNFVRCDVGVFDDLEMPDVR